MLPLVFHGRLIKRVSPPNSVSLISWAEFGFLFGGGAKLQPAEVCLGNTFSMFPTKFCNFLNFHKYLNQMSKSGDDLFSEEDNAAPP